MATRKELLQELNAEIDRLADAIDTGFKDLSYASSAIDRLDESMVEHGRIQAGAAEQISRSISGAGDNLIAAAAITMVGGILNTIVSTFAHMITVVFDGFVDLMKESREKSHMINSIQSLQAIYPRLCYDFLVQRTYVPETGRKQRRTILNGLISDGIVTTHLSDAGEEWFTVEQSNPALAEHWERVEALQQAVNTFAEALTARSRGALPSSLGGATKAKRRSRATPRRRKS